MAQTTAEAIKAARESRGLTVYALCQQADGVGTGSVQALEGGADPSKVTVRVAMGLIRALWPALRLSHFAPGKDLKVMPVDKRADRRLRGRE